MRRYLLAVFFALVVVVLARMGDSWGTNIH